MTEEWYSLLIQLGALHKKMHQIDSEIKERLLEMEDVKREIDAVGQKFDELSEEEA